MNGMASLQGMYMWNIEALPQIVQKLWQSLKVLDIDDKGHRQGH